MAERAKFVPTQDDIARLERAGLGFRGATAPASGGLAPGAVQDLTAAQAWQFTTSGRPSGGAAYEASPQPGPALGLRDFAAAGQLRPDADTTVPGAAGVQPPSPSSRQILMRSEPAGVTPLFTNRPGLLGDAGVATGYGDIVGNMSLQDARNRLSAPITGPMQGARAAAGQPGVFLQGGEAVTAAPVAAGARPIPTASEAPGVFRPVSSGDVVQDNLNRWMAEHPEANGVLPGFGARPRSFGPAGTLAGTIMQANLSRAESADAQRGFRQEQVLAESNRQERDLALAEAELPSILGLRAAQIRQADAQAQQSLAKAEGTTAEEQPFEFRQPNVDRFTGEATPGKIKIGKTEYDVTADQMTTISPIAQQRAAGWIADYQAEFGKAPTLQKRLAIINAAHAEAWSQLYAPKAEVK